MATIKREVMPQISVKDVKEFRKHLLDYGITTQLQMVSPVILKPTQSEYNKDKVNKIHKDMGDPHDDSPVIVSQDYKILDGHHRWLARAKKDKHGKMLILRCNAPIDKIFKAAHKFPEVEVKDITELRNYLL